MTLSPHKLLSSGDTVATAIPGSYVVEWYSPASVSSESLRGSRYFLTSFKPQRRHKSVLFQTVRTNAAQKRVTVDMPKPPAWLGQALATIESFGIFKPGWNGYDAPPPNGSAIDLAKRYIKQLALLGIRPRSLMPTAVGGVAVLVKAHGRTAITEFYNAGGACAAYTSGRVSPRVHSFIADGLGREIHRAKKFLYGKSAD